MKPAICFIVVATLSIAGAVTHGKAQAPSASASNIEAAIRAVAAQYAKATLAADSKSIAALYTDDAVEMPPNQPAVKGRAAIQQYYEKQFAAAKIATFTLSHVETRAVGDNGYDVGTYRQNVALPGGLAIDDTGKYIVIMKRGTAGWKIAYAIYSSDRPVPTVSSR